MTAHQLDLFAAADERPIGVVTICEVCGAATDPIPVEGGASAPWMPAILWGYAALKSHQREHHPDRA